MNIKLEEGILVFTGRSRGRADRQRYQLDALDAEAEAVVVVIPGSVYTMTSSYFLELFGNSIRRLGRERFHAHYRFEGPEHVVRKLDDWIARALREKKGLFGGELE